MWDFNGLGRTDPVEVPFLLVEARAGSGLKSTQKLLQQSVFCEVKRAGMLLRLQFREISYTKTCGHHGPTP